MLGDEVYCLLIPLQHDRLIVPRSCIAEVIRESLPFSDASADDWICGSVEWNAREIPILSFERLCGKRVATGGGRSRIVVFNGISEGADARQFGVLCEGFPQMVRVNAEVAEADPDYSVPEQVPVLCRVRLINEQALVPALDEIEALIRDSEVAGQELDKA
jgi:chemosensory pili system protein ChpC